ncbi:MULTISPECIES: colicin immunity domain-containing protein [unclassified Streptomyces]|uniref:colicin immunity domain-containing protein n=1 Tax=unclassified Streptomyces TaxID=2593676 RepID=UPI0013C90E00|nr:hypothetical protein [Streptomyces sp. SID10362]
MKNRDLIRLILTPAGDFQEDWKGSPDAKSVVPLPAQAGLSHVTARQVVAGAREAGAAAVLVASLAPDRQDMTVVEAALGTDALLEVVSRTQGNHDALLVADNLRGALLPKSAYALLGGTKEFMRGALPDGPDKARDEFHRYARKIQGAEPHIMRVASDFPPRSRTWKRLEDLPAESHTGRQVALMRDLLSGAVDGPAFARRWLEERRCAMDAGERVGEDVAAALDDVFYSLEDYTIDPSLRDEGDLTDEELRRDVADVVQRLHGGPERPRR